jgi:hypothetical protein
MATPSKQGIKFDTGKPALDLIEPFFELDLGQVLTFGALKYDVDNWKRGMSIGKALAGVKRHINAISRGEYTDPETKLQHAAHAACGLMFIHYFVRNGVLDVPDDRWIKKAEGLVEGILAAQATKVWEPGPTSMFEGPTT